MTTAQRALWFAAMMLSFGALTAHGAAPAGRYRVTAGTVTDLFTGLVWQQSVDAGALGWNAADAYCKGLTLDGGGWRVPGLKELLTLVDIKVTPSVDAKIFPNTPADGFWTASKYRGLADDVWVVHFDTGRTSHFGLNFPNRVRCVR